MRRIKRGELRFLVATDVAARGIDISDLSHVISYSAPDSPEVYLHRTGRTGRAGKTGTAISLVSGLDIGNFRSIQKVNRMVIPERHTPGEGEVVDRLARRAQVKIEHDLRELPERQRQAREEEFLPVVDKLVASEEGRRDLAAILFNYLRGQPARAGQGAPGGAEAAGQPPASEPSGGEGVEPARRPPEGRKRRRRRRSAGTR